jgi:hypothetical protein
MTFYLETGATTKEISTNITNLTPSTYYLAVTSQYNKNTWSFALTIVESNARYTKFSLPISASDREGHYNGIYDYEIKNIAGDIYDSGLLKWISEEGGSTNIEPYISNNENREAGQYYRPNF